MSSVAPSPTGSFAHSFRVAMGLIWIDIKQGLRKHTAGTTRRDRVLKATGIFFGLLFFAGLHVAAFALYGYAWSSPSRDQASLMAGISTSLWCFLLFVMISGGLVRALVVLHEQDDSSLLLSSPISPRAVLAARLFGNALQSCLVDGFIIVPYINVRACVGGGNPKFLWGYLLWFTLAIIVTCVDGLFSFGMIRWMGLKRARLFSQAVPFILVFGVTFFAGSLSVSVAEMNIGGTPHMPEVLQDKFIALGQSPLAWLAYAAVGRVVQLPCIIVFAVVLAWFTLRVTERSFIEGTQNLAENETAAGAGTADAPFRTGVLQLEVRKNLRLIVRTPMMIVQCIAQVLTPVGIAFVLGRADPARGAAFFMVFVAGVLAGIFTIAAGTVEECDDLLRMSPHGTFLFRLGKMLSGCLFPLGMTVLVALGLLLAGSYLQALGVLLAGVPLAIASSIVGETFAKPVRTGTRPKLLSDPIMIIPLLGMQITSGCVAGLAVFTAAFSFQFLLLGLLASYLVMVLIVGLAQLRKPLMVNF